MDKLKEHTQDTWISNFDSKDLFNRIRQVWTLNILITCHWIPFEFSAIPEKNWIDLVNYELALSSKDRIPEILLLKWNIWSINLWSYLLKWRVRIDRENNISFIIKTIERRDLENIRQERRIMFFWKDFLLDKEDFWDNFHIDSHRIILADSQLWDNHISWLLHDISITWAWIFLNNSDSTLISLDDFKKITDRNDWISNLDIVTWNKLIITKFKVINILDYQKNWYFRVWWKFVDVCINTKELIYWLMLQWEQSAIKKLKSMKNL